MRVGDHALLELLDVGELAERWLARRDGDSSPTLLLRPARALGGAASDARRRAFREAVTRWASLAARDAMHVVPLTLGPEPIAFATHPTPEATLESVLMAREVRGAPLPPPTLATIVRDVAAALRATWAKGFAHGAPTAGAVHLDRHGVARLADHGLSGRGARASAAGDLAELGRWLDRALPPPRTPGYGPFFALLDASSVTLEERLAALPPSDRAALAAEVRRTGAQPELDVTLPAEDASDAPATPSVRPAPADAATRTRAPASDLGQTVAELDHTLASEVPPPRADSDPPPIQSMDPTERYRLHEVLGRGQQGEVRRAFDRLLRREVAMKIAHDPIEPDALERFIAEATLTAQLGHPHVVPIHDAGRWEGRPFYTMPLLLRGSLADLLDELRAGVGPSLVRRMRTFSSVCMAMQAVHERGVVHRDLKPANLVLGPTGELLVADFGLARAASGGDLALPLRLARTAEGAPLGTPLYMAPEQARGELDRIGPRSDVYALGAILYELLTLRPPLVRPSFTAQLVAILQERPPEPETVVEGGEVPYDLARLAMACLEKAPEDRPASAEELVDAIEGWLDGRFEEERRQRDAVRLVREAARERHRAEELGAQIAALEEELRAGWAATPEHAALGAKEPLWAQEEEVERLRRQRDELEEGTELRLESALRASGHRAAREGLVKLHLARRARALAAHRPEQAAREERKALRVGGEAVRRRLHADAAVAIDCATPWRVLREVETRGRREPEPFAERAPELRLAPGSYRVRAEVEGRTVDVPFLVAPGEALRLELDVAPAAALPEGFVLVHGGASWLGGDADAQRTEARERVELPSFALAVFPVTCAEWLAFLRDAFDDLDDALRHAPRPAADAPAYWSASGGRVVMPTEDADGDAWDPRFPVFGISAHDVQAYLRWRSTRDGRAYRLASDREWERAARGADGRIYPWGDRFDPALCKMRLSREGDFAPEPVGAFATDVSPFGVRDLAGGIAEWTRSAYRDDPAQRCVKGGAWSTRAHRCAATFRGMMLEGHVSGDLGFRLALDV